MNESGDPVCGSAKLVADTVVKAFPLCLVFLSMLIWGCSPPAEKTVHPQKSVESNPDVESTDSDPSNGEGDDPEETDAPDPDDTGEPDDVDDTDEPSDPVGPVDTAETIEEVVDCSLISAANPAWEVCEEGPAECAGVFTDGSGCEAYCAAAGLVCTARFGGEPGCLKEAEAAIDCAASNGHRSDWCICGVGEIEGGDPSVGSTDCESDPAHPPVTAEIAYTEAIYTERHNWVLACRDYAYSAHGAEHRECDSSFDPDGARTGTATFVFEDVPRGLYDAYMGGRHTENRNPAGALFIVDGHSAIIDQRTGSAHIWDLHGRYCLEGRVEVVLDSTVNSGSDSVFGVRLQPAG